MNRSDKIAFLGLKGIYNIDELPDQILDNLYINEKQLRYSDEECDDDNDYITELACSEILFLCMMFIY